MLVVLGFVTPLPPWASLAQSVSQVWVWCLVDPGPMDAGVPGNLVSRPLLCEKGALLPGTFWKAVGGLGAWWLALGAWWLALAGWQPTDMAGQVS